MKYTGGGCNQTATNQQIPCFDFQGGPSPESGSEGFVVVTFEDTIYHQAWVTVGSQYSIRDGSGAALGAPQSIVVYRSEDQDPSNVLQSLVFDGSCDETLELLNQFGASQVVGFTVNGVTTRSSFNATIELEVSLPSGPDARLDTLLVSSSEGTFDVSGQIAGSILSAGDTETASFTVDLDLTVPRVLLFLANVTATNVNDSGLRCGAESFLSIPVGPIDDVEAGNFQEAAITMRGPF
jgi:hypothetical protein